MISLSEDLIRSLMRCSCTILYMNKGVQVEKTKMVKDDEYCKAYMSKRPFAYLPPLPPFRPTF